MITRCRRAARTNPEVPLMLKYQYTYETRNGTCPATPYEESNARRAVRAARAMARGNGLRGEAVWYRVWRSGMVGPEATVAMGEVAAAK